MSSHSVPIIGIFGPAGSGKDTAASYIASVYNGVCVAQADPMKRFAAQVFGFSEDQLWGPSENRNAVDPKTVTHRHQVYSEFYKYTRYSNEILDVILPAYIRTGSGHRLNVSYTPLNPLKRLEEWFQNIYHNLELDIPVSPRLVLQTLGAEWGRNVSKELWSNYAIETCRQLLCGGQIYTPNVGLTPADKFPGFDFACITDGRFRNEVTNLRMAGGIAIRINRQTDAAVVESAGVKNHSSERELDGIPGHFFNQTIQNNGTIEQLASRLDSVITYQYGV